MCLYSPWATRYDSWLIIPLTPKGVVLSFFLSVQSDLHVQAAKEKLCGQRRIVSSIFDQVKHEQLKMSMRQKRIRHLLSAEDGVQQQLQLSSKLLTCGKAVPVLSTELTIPIQTDFAAPGTVLAAPGIRSAGPGTGLVWQQPSASSKRSCAPFPPGVQLVLACSSAVLSVAQHKQIQSALAVLACARACAWQTTPALQLICSAS